MTAFHEEYGVTAVSFCLSLTRYCVLWRGWRLSRPLSWVRNSLPELPLVHTGKRLGGGAMLAALGVVGAHAQASEGWRGEAAHAERRVASSQAAPQVCPETVSPLQAAALQALQAQQPPAPDRGLLWQLEKGGHRSWLFGTMHLGRKPWLQLGPQLQRALQHSDTLALEVDLTDPRTTRQLEANTRHSAPPIPRAAQLRVADQLQRVCVPGMALSSVAAHVQASALVVLVARTEGLYAEYGSERVLATLAKAQGKSVVAIENVRMQAALLKGATPQADVEQLNAALDELESGHTMAQLSQLGRVWAQGDADLLARYDDWCDCVNSEADRAAQHRVLDARNGPMADAFERLHGKGQSVLMAVGALHTVGKAGLAAELRRRGFTVTPLMGAELAAH